MRWLRPFAPVQLLYVLAIALPSMISVLHEDSRVLALQTSNDLAESEHTDHTRHEHSLQSRNINGAMALWYGSATFVPSGVVMLYRGNHDVIGYTMLATGLPSFTFNTIYGLREMRHQLRLQSMRHDNERNDVELDWGDRDLEKKIRKYRSDLQDYNEAELEYKNAKLEIDKKKLDQDEQLRVAGHAIELKKLEVQRKTLNHTTWKEREEVKKAGEERIGRIQQQIRDRTDNIISINTKLEELKTARRDDRKADDSNSEAAMKAEREVFEKARGLLQKAENCVDQLSQTDDPDKLESIRKESRQAQDEAQKLLEQVVTDEATSGVQPCDDQPLDEDEIKKMVQSIPGAFPDRRRRHRSNNMPRLIREQSSNCEREDCYRVWFSSHLPETNKRAIADDTSSYPIHDFLITPLDFEFQDDETLQRRGTGNGTLAKTNDSGQIKDQDCVFEEEKDGKKRKYNVRVVSQFGGDDESLDVLIMMGENTFIDMWMNDVKKLPTTKKDGYEYSAWLQEGLSCWSFDLNGGVPAAWLAYTISDDPRWTTASAEDLIKKCKKKAKGSKL